MPEKYDFKSMFSKPTENIATDEYRAFNTLYLSEAMNRPPQEIESNYEEVAKTFVGEDTVSDQAVFQKIKGAVLPEENLESEWNYNIVNLANNDEPDDFVGRYWEEGEGAIVREQAALGKLSAEAITATLWDIIPSMARGISTLPEQMMAEDERRAEEGVPVVSWFTPAQRQFWDELMENPFVQQMLHTPRQFIDESGQLKASKREEYKRETAKYGTAAEVIGDVSMGLVDTAAFLATMRMANIKIGATPSQAANAPVSAQQIARLKQAGGIGLLRGMTSEANSIEERANIAAISMLYMGTPAASGVFAERRDVFVADLILNSTITAPQVVELWGREDLSDAEKISESIKMFGSDVIFSAMTTTMRGNPMSPRWKPMVKASKELVKKGATTNWDAADAIRNLDVEVDRLQALNKTFADPKNRPQSGDKRNRGEGETERANVNGKGFINADVAKAQQTKEIENLERTLIEQERAEQEKATPAPEPEKLTLGEGFVKEEKPEVVAKAPEVSPASERRQVLLETINRTAGMSVERRIDEINRTAQDLADGKPPKEVRSKVKTRIKKTTGVSKQPDIIKVDEYQMLKKQIRDYNKGIKAGKKLGKKEAVEAQRKRQGQIDGIRQIARDYASSKIHDRDLRNSVNNTIDKITTDTQLDKVLETIDKRVAEQKHLDAVKGVEKELKKIQKLKLHPTQQKQFNNLLDGISQKKVSDKKLESLIKSSEYFGADVREEYMPDYLARAIDNLGKKQIRDLTTDDLITIRAGLQSIRSQQKLKEQLTARNQRRKIENAATEYQKQVSDPDMSPLIRVDKEGIDRPEYKGSIFSNIHKMDLNPDGWAFIGDGGREGVLHQMLVKNFWAGEDRELALKQYASSYMEPFHDTIRGWDKSDINATVGGRKIKISRGERIAMYLDSLNEQNNSHAINGGYVLRSNPNVSYKITEAERNAITDKMTAEDYAVAQAIQDGYQNILRPALNETSTKVIGYEIATIDNYHPMTTPKGFRATEGETITPASLRSFNEYLIDSSGHFKERSAKAQTPIMLQDAIKKYDQMVSMISKYHGFAEPLRDAKEFLGGKTADGTSVRSVIESTVGSRYIEMAEDLIKDIEQGYEKSNRGWKRKVNAKLNKATNNVVRGILGHNVKVMGMQPISYETALNVLPAKYHAWGRVMRPASWEEMGKHSSFLWDRGEGHLSIAFGESTKEKAANRGMRGIQEMDRQAVGRIWRACEKWVEDDLGHVDYKEVAKRANNVVRRTQPTFSIVDRPAIARSDDVLLRTLSMFTSQRNKNHTLKLKNDVEMLEKLKTGKATDEDWKNWGAKTMLNRVWTPSLVAGYLTLWGIITGKKSRSLINRFLNNFANVSLSEIGPTSSALMAEGKALLSKVVDSVDGREVSSALISTYKNIISSLGKLANTVSVSDEIMYAEDREKINEKRAEAIEDLIRESMKASGLGEYHYWDYLQHIKAWTEDEDDEFKF